MAECTAYTSIVVSGAGATSLNGTYIPFSTTTIGGVTFTSYTKDGEDSLPILQAESAFGNFYVWAIRGGFGFEDSQGKLYYGRPTSITYYRTTSPLNCPNEVALWDAINITPEPLPTVTGVEGGGGSEPTFGLPADVVSLMVAAHGSVANFLRLRNQGQI